MTSKLPPLLALQAFEVAARHCSFTQAAKELNLTQSAVSHRIKQLENFLGYDLFTRLPRSLVLNDIGKAYLPSVKKTFRELSISTNSVFGNKNRKTINIRAPLAHAVLWLTPILDEFLITYPNVSVRVISELWAHDPQQFKSDFELRLGYGYWMATLPNSFSMKLLSRFIVSILKQLLVKFLH